MKNVNYNTKKIMEVMNEIIESKSFKELQTKQGKIIIDIQTASLVSQIWKQSTQGFKDKVEKCWVNNEAICLQNIWRIVNSPR